MAEARAGRPPVRRRGLTTAALLVCGLLASPTAPGSAAPLPAAHHAAAAPGSAAAPWATPSRAVPGERVVLRGRIGTRAGRRVVLARETTTGWSRVARGTTRKGGRYRFAVTASAARLTFVVKAPRSGGRRAVRSRPVVVRPWRGAEYWFAHDMCRVERPPDHLVYCARRDDVLRRLGAVNAREFARAWRSRDESAMLRLAADPAVVDAALSVPVRRTAPDCEYDATPLSWSCSLERAADGSSTGARSEVVRQERPRLPVWKVVAAGVPAP